MRDVHALRDKNRDLSREGAAGMCAAAVLRERLPLEGACARGPLGRPPAKLCSFSYVFSHVDFRPFF
jgi:hypothetical protein